MLSVQDTAKVNVFGGSHAPINTSSAITSCMQRYAIVGIPIWEMVVASSKKKRHKASNNITATDKLRRHVGRDSLEAVRACLVLDACATNNTDTQC